jgi:hypothetical protein
MIDFNLDLSWGLKTSVGAVCFGEGKAMKNAEAIEQVSDNLVTLKVY